MNTRQSINQNYPLLCPFLSSFSFFLLFPLFLPPPHRHFSPNRHDRIIFHHQLRLDLFFYTNVLFYSAHLYHYDCLIHWNAGRNLFVVPAPWPQIAIRVPKLAYTLWNIASHFFVLPASFKPRWSVAAVYQHLGSLGYPWQDEGTRAKIQIADGKHTMKAPWLRDWISFSCFFAGLGLSTCPCFGSQTNGALLPTSYENAEGSQRVHGSQVGARGWCMQPFSRIQQAAGTSQFCQALGGTHRIGNSFESQIWQQSFDLRNCFKFKADELPFGHLSPMVQYKIYKICWTFMIYDYLCK